MTKETLTRVCVVLAILLFLLLMKEACTVGALGGWFARGSWDENHVILDKKDGMPVIQEHQRVILQRHGTEIEINQDDTGRESFDVIPSRRPAPQPARTHTTPRRQPAPQPPAAPCVSSQSGCPPASDGLKPIKRRN